jgi:hypothetical protein
MVFHLVLLKPRPDLSREARLALVAAFEHAVRDIPSVRGTRVGKRVVHGAGYEATAPDAADFSVTIEFEDLAGLKAYLAHPAHAELGRRFGDSLSAAFVYDFEEQDLAAIAREASGGGTS